jgi:hypothetical protein
MNKVMTLKIVSQRIKKTCQGQELIGSHSPEVLRRRHTPGREKDRKPSEIVN